MNRAVFDLYSTFAFSGSRNSIEAEKRVLAIVALVKEKKVFVGCAAGVDRVVRNHVLNAVVFRVDKKKDIPFAAALAIRSEVMVSLLAAEENPVLLAFPATVCPDKVIPRRTFKGHGSGTWGTIALAVWLELPVCVSMPEGLYPPHWFLSRSIPVGTDSWLLETRKKRTFLEKKGEECL